jgi:regulator of protease activity HflC (stomatin/prohibitin superfamily)
MDAEEAMKKHMAALDAKKYSNQATEYARRFLAQKYREEYSELYSAYCRNRGILTKRNRKPVIDERELLDD